jgi:membrane protease YdiL (CAAX protease family)
MFVEPPCLAAGRKGDLSLLVIVRHATGSALARLRQLVREPDPVLLMGRERRWRWPWLLLGLAAAFLLSAGLAMAPSAFESLALQQGWITYGFSSQVFPFEPDRPLSFIYDLLFWLPFLLPPLVVLSVIHGVSWRRAFSYGIGFQWHQFWRAALALLLLVAVGSAVGYLLAPEQYRFSTFNARILPWIVLGCGMVFVQTLAEDVFFRGYLLRAVGAVLPFRIPVTAGVIAVFVHGHLGNRDFQRDIVLVVLYFVMMEIISYAVLFRTQNLAASAGLHWMGNTTYLLLPDAPELITSLALAVYIDPVYTIGGSKLFDPQMHISTCLFLGLLLLLLLWRRSPFYLEKAPSPVATEPPSAILAAAPVAQAT